MKKNEKIVEKVKQYQNKRGVRYATHEGELYKFLKVLYTLTFAYNLVFNVFYILVILVSLDAGSFNYNAARFNFLTVCIATGVMIAGYVLTLISKTRWAGRIVSVVALAASALALFSAVSGSETATGIEITRFLGVPFYYWWRHLIPALAGVAVLAWMMIIDILAIFRYNRLYKRLEDELYRQFRAKNEDDLSDENWQSFLDESIKSKAED